MIAKAEKRLRLLRSILGESVQFESEGLLVCLAHMAREALVMGDTHGAKQIVDEAERLLSSSEDGNGIDVECIHDEITSLLRSIDEAINAMDSISDKDAVAYMRICRDFRFTNEAIKSLFPILL